MSETDATPHPGGVGQVPPRISVVTPCLNGARYLEAAILSVVGQRYPNLEYVVIDGGSTDASVEIIRRHESALAGWVSEPDRGQAHALNKGFARTTGEIMGWLNTDDVLHPGSLWLLARTFRAFGEIEWLTGQASFVEPGGATVIVEPPPRWSRLGFLAGDYRWIQQESTFWRRSLWDRAGSRLSEHHSLACDFELWVRFFRHARLHSSFGLVGALRLHPDQRTRRSMDVYEREAHEIIGAEQRRLLDEGMPQDSDGWKRSPPVVKFDWRDFVFRMPREER
jgi:hypothetical protein